MFEINDIGVFLRSIPFYAQLIANRFNVEVIWGGDGAKTDGRKIFTGPVPSPDNQADSSAVKELGAVLLGRMLHEVAHVCHCDWAAVNETQFESSFHHGLWNIIQDARDENCMVATYKGADHWLQALHRINWDKTQAGQEDGRDHSPESTPAELLSDYLYATTKVEMRHQNYFSQKRRLLREQVEAAFPADVVASIDCQIENACKAATTRDCLTVAKALYDLLRDSSKTGDSPDEENGSTVQDPSVDCETNGTQSEDETSSTTDGEAKRKQLEEALSEGKAFDRHDVGQRSAEAIQDAKAEGVVSMACDAGTAQPNKVDSGLRAGNARGGRLTFSGQMRLDEVRVATAALRNRLSSLLEARSRVRKRHRDTGSRIDPRRLGHVYRGDLRVFRHVTEGKKLDTAIYLLLDTSGSMTGQRIDLAEKALLAATLACDPIRGVAIAAGAFPTMESLFDFGCPARHLTHRLGITPGGGTPLAKGIEFAASQLIPRPEARKILVTLTDGEASNVSVVRDRLQSLSLLGVETLGLGIGSDGTSAVKNLFATSAGVNQLNELPIVLLSMLDHVLLGSSRRAA